MPSAKSSKSVYSSSGGGSSVIIVQNKSLMATCGGALVKLALVLFNLALLVSFYYIFHYRINYLHFSF